jgi:hypothetical protein
MLEYPAIREADALGSTARRDPQAPGIEEPRRAPFLLYGSQ